MKKRVLAVFLMLTVITVAASILTCNCSMAEPIQTLAASTAVAGHCDHAKQTTSSSHQHAQDCPECMEELFSILPQGFDSHTQSHYLIRSGSRFNSNETLSPRLFEASQASAGFVLSITPPGRGVSIPFPEQPIFISIRSLLI